MKSRLVFGLLAVMVLLTLAPSSFAQVSIQVFNTPSPKEVATNRTAETSDPVTAGSGITVSGTFLAASDLGTTNLILTFPATITSGANSTSGAPDTAPSGDLIRIVSATGVFSTASIVTRSGATLTISLIGGPITGNTNSGSFRVVSTRIDANGLSGSGPFNATATLNNSANNFVLTSNPTSFPVISALGPGIGAVAQNVISGTNPGPLTVFTNRTVVNPGTSTRILLTEGFEFAWRTEGQNEHNGASPETGATQIRLTFAGIPATSQLTLGTPTVSSGASATITGNTTVPPSLTGSSSTNFTSFLTITGDKPDAIDQIEVPVTISAPTSSPSLGSITVTASMFPVAGTGYLTQVTNSAGSTTSTVVFPRYNAAEVGPATIGNVIAATTTLLLPLAEKLAVGFDTGISIANTTADPFGASNGGATATAGKLTFDFFPRTTTGAGTPFSLTTSATVKPGTGLSADGTLAAGGTWTALLSELLTAAAQPGDFVGYIFIRTDFLNAHGMATVSDFKTTSLASQVLVLDPPSITSRSKNASESLNQ